MRILVETAENARHLVGNLRGLLEGERWWFRAISEYADWIEALLGSEARTCRGEMQSAGQQSEPSGPSFGSLFRTQAKPTVERCITTSPTIRRRNNHLNLSLPSHTQPSPCSAPLSSAAPALSPRPAPGHTLLLPSAAPFPLLSPLHGHLRL